ncbi:heavy metal translocating P-type ATPase [Leptolyngbya sp. NIES-2104]|uniref:heavy metal translocating P-type ATPase n=1 Tax=Leptolyngbya sp. NIES-2104 TaxID=1552121 RepID=UPI0006EC4558|nr:heavy metal translocating P-type ATPase [Leptolyngbya sp. NIES-2104]GAP94851.1 cation-transporting ATPase [Leptolyngbya sp. NIES-2104]
MATQVNDRTIVCLGSPNRMTYQMVHTVPGRCRFRVPRLKQEQEYAERLNWFVESLSFVITLRINALAESLVIYYTPNAITLESLESAIAGALDLATTGEIPIGAISTKTEYRPEINWLERLGLPVTSLGLAIAAEQLALPLIPTLLVGGVVIAASLPFIVRTIETTLKEKRLDADILDALWMTLYTIKGDLVAPSLMVSLMETGEALRDTTARVSEREVSQLVGGMNQTIRIERGGQEEWVPIDSIKLGDRAVVYAGERLPVSGRVLRGTGWIDEHELTGELTFVCRSEGQVVHAGTLLLDGKLCILVKRMGRNTRLGLTLQLLQSAPVHDTRVEDYAAKLANMAIAPSLILGGIIFALTRDVSRALAPLHLDFSHGIRLSVPSTVLSALTYASRHGIYIRSGRALEVLARVDAIAFDKTGTLTQGNAAVKVVRTVNTRTSIKEVLTLAASVEKDNKHPVAAAILNASAAKGVQLRECETWEYRVGAGIVAQIDGQQVLVGSHRLMQKEEIETTVIHSRYPELQTECFSLVYVARSGKLLGAISYTDPLRPEAHQVIRQLHQSEDGIETYILTGDNPQVAEEVAAQLGIDTDRAYAEMSPQGKVKVIQHLQAQGKVVAFVGEGINDVAALAHADVSIAIATGSDMARETADIVLLDDDLEDVIHAIEIAKRSMEIIYQNTALVAVPNISVVLAGIIFALDPILSVIISNGSMLLAELNSFRPLFDPGEDPFAKNQPPAPPKQINSTDSPIIAELA